MGMSLFLFKCEMWKKMGGEGFQIAFDQFIEQSTPLSDWETKSYVQVEIEIV